MRGISRSEIARKSIAFLLLVVILLAPGFGYIYHEGLVDFVMELLGVDSINIMYPRLFA